MAGRSELGISPVLLQAIAQTLTSTAVSGREPGKGKDSTSLFTRQDIFSSSSMNNAKDANTVTRILQNLNEPIASLMTAQKENPPLHNVATMCQSQQQSNQSNFTQAGLSMLGITENDSFSTDSNIQTCSKTPQPMPQAPSHMIISGEEINNFLMKQEPSEDSDQSQKMSAPPNSLGMNTEVSSMLSALATQHIQQQSVAQKNNSPNIKIPINTQREQPNIPTNDMSAVVSSSDTNNSDQSQIIIYSYVNSSGQNITVPVSLSQGNDNVMQDPDVNADVQRTYRVLLQSPEDIQDNKQNVISSNMPAPQSSTSHVMPVTDSQNTQLGMSLPCPICGDKVSGYHYGIFTCESCKGFFKRTVQNKKTFVCPKSSDCDINSLNRKKCPACRFQRCILMGMKLEAIRQDRTRGGRSSYEGCGAHVKRSPLEKKMKRMTGSSQDGDDGSKSHKNLVAILNHNVHKQPQNLGVPQIPELLRDIMNLEPLLSDDDIPTDSIMEGSFPEHALYSYMLQLAELRLYKLVRWARNLPQFGAISTDDQILLLQNCWSELIALSLCWRSIDTPGQISISSTHHITAEWAQHLGFEDVVLKLLSITDSFRKLYLDQFEYVALKVLLLITPDVKGLKEPRKIRDFQEKLQEALMTYTTTHYQNLTFKFGELLLRLPELSRISFMSKDILLKSLPETIATCGLLVELLKGENKGDADASNCSSASGGAACGFPV